MGESGLARWSRRPWTLLTALTLIAGVVALFTHERLFGLMPPCVFHRWTGCFCPGCGGRRCLMLLFQGRWLEALHMNALVIATGLGFFCLLAHETWRECSRSGQPFVITPLRGWLVVGGILGFWLLRNLPFRPFVWLAPVPL